MLLAKLPALILSLVLFLSLSSVSFAQTQNTLTAPQTTRSTGTLQSRAILEIDRRIAALTNSLNRLDAVTLLTADAIANERTQIQTEIQNLSSLKSQIQSETNSTALQPLVSQVTSSLNFYAVFVPKVMVITTAERLITVSDLLASVQTRLLEMAVSSGQDISDVETLLVDAQEQIAQGRASAESAIETVSALETEGYPGNRTALQSARADLVEARTSLLSARQSLGEALSAINTLGSTGSAETFQETTEETVEVMPPSTDTLQSEVY